MKKCLYIAGLYLEVLPDRVQYITHNHQEFCYALDQIDRLRKIAKMVEPAIYLTHKGDGEMLEYTDPQDLEDIAGNIENENYEHCLIITLTYHER